MLLLFPDGLARPLASTRIRFRALSPYRQPAPVTQAAIGTEIHQALDIHGNRAAQVALNHDLGDLSAYLLDFGVSQVFHLGGGGDAGVGADGARPRAPNTIYGRQSHIDMLMIRYIYACNSGHAQLSPEKLTFSKSAQGYWYNPQKSMR
jgi:hypothetical protein